MVGSLVKKAYNLGYGVTKQVIDKKTGKKRNVLRSLERDPEELVVLQPSGKKVKRKDARYVVGKSGRVLYVDPIKKNKHIDEVITPELKRLKKELPDNKARNIKRDILQRHLNKKLIEAGYPDKTLQVRQVGLHAKRVLGEPTVKTPFGKRKTKASEDAKKALLKFLRTKGEYPVKRGKVVTTPELAQDPIFQKISPSGSPGSVESLIDRLRAEKGLKRDWSIGVEKNLAGLTRGRANKAPEGILRNVLQESFFNPRLKKMLLNAMNPRIRKIAEKNDRAFIEGLHEIIFPARTKATPPTHANLFNRNRVHYGAELRLRRLNKVLKERDIAPDEKMSIFMEMAGIEDDMIKLGLQSEIDGVVYGRAYAKGADKLWKYILPIMRDLKKSYPLKELAMPGSGKMRRPPKFKEEGFAGGGLIKKGIQKLIDSTAFNQSRRKFLKQASVTAAATAIPKSILKGASTLAQSSKLPLPDAVPWVKTMTNMLKGVVDSKKAIKLPNGTEIFYLKKPYTQWDSHKLSIKTADGNEDFINFKERKNDFEIEFDIADDFATNQYIEIDKKTGYTEMIDSNLRMAPGGEDVIKDDPIVWAMEKTDDIGYTTISDDYMHDYMSIPNDTDYSHLFERYVDSFSPAGNIFKTKQYTQAEKAKRIAEKETREMEWEEQFRGGYGMHGYYRGGMTMDDYKDMPSRPTRPTRPVMDTNRLLDSIKLIESGGELNPNRAFSRKGAMGAYQIMPGTARQPGYEKFGAYAWPTFEQEYRLQGPDFESKSRKWAGSYLNAMYDRLGGWDKAISAYFWGPGNVLKDEHNLDYYNKVMEAYNTFNRGGMAEKFNVDDAVAMIRANPQSFVGGGLVKKMAPKVLGKLTDFKPKLTGPDLARVRTDLYTPPKGPYTITDEGGVRVLDKTFKNLDEAQDALKELSTLRTQDASTFKIFGARPPKTKEGVNEAAPQVDLGMVGKKLPPEQPGAMFWGSREKIIGAPSESMTGDQWLQYMQLGKHGILNPKGYPVVKHMELNDTGLATHLSRSGKKTISKEQLVKDFDNKLAPDIDVAVLGSGQRNLNVLRQIDKINLQEYREGPLKNVLTTLKNRRALLEESVSNNNKENIIKNIDAIENSVFTNLGVANSITKGFPQKFPFELKKPLHDIAQVTGSRLAGFKKYAKDVEYRNQQTLGGGENYREFLFRSSNKPGSTRAVEPVRAYDELGGQHFSGLSSKDKTGGFAHMRTSDRTDEFGRRILHIEEIQSDMHQPINAAQRALKKKHADWAKAGKTPEGEYAKMNKSAQKDYNALVKKSKYAPRGDVMKEVDDVNEDQLKLILAKIEELSAKPQTKQTQVRIARLNKERAKVRKIIADKRAKMTEGEHSNVPQGPFSKTEDYNEFVIKYATRVAQEGGYDGVTISSSAIKNRSLNPSNKDFMGNVIAYGPMAEGAMKKAAKKSGAKFIKTAIIDDKGRGWEVPMIWLDDGAKMNVQKGLPIYKRGGIAING